MRNQGPESLRSLNTIHSSTSRYRLRWILPSFNKFKVCWWHHFVGKFRSSIAGTRGSNWQWRQEIQSFNKLRQNLGNVNRDNLPYHDRRQYTGAGRYFPIPWFTYYCWNWVFKGDPLTIGKGHSIAKKLKKIWQNHGIAISTKVRLFKALIWPVYVRMWELDIEESR